MAQGFCCTGRPRKGVPDGEPIVAWINEAPCKLIYMNLRTTVSLEHGTGVDIDYLHPDRCFPGAADPLVAVA
jgi:hypothetical protein